MKSLTSRLKSAFVTASAALAMATTFPANANETSSVQVTNGPAPMPPEKPPASMPAPAQVAPVIAPDRIVRLREPIDTDVAHRIRDQLLQLDAKAPGTPIEMRINSPGGDVSAGLMIYDTMKSLKSPVATTCESECMSMAAVLLAAGTPGMRTALPSAVVMIHELSADLPRLKYSNMKPWQGYMDFLERRMVTILSDYTGRSKEELAEIMRRDTFYPANDAKKLGLIDRVIEPIQHPPKKKPSTRPTRPMHRFGQR